MLAVHWPEIGRCTMCAALVAVEDAAKHKEWHKTHAKAWQSVADWAKSFGQEAHGHETRKRWWRL